jgi:hypothetical protein
MKVRKVICLRSETKKIGNPLSFQPRYFQALKRKEMKRFSTMCMNCRFSTSSFSLEQLPSLNSAGVSKRINYNNFATGSRSYTSNALTRTSFTPTLLHSTFNGLSAQTQFDRRNFSSSKMSNGVKIDNLSLAEPAENYVSHRIALFDRLKAEQSAVSPSVPITVTLPDGKVLADTFSFLSTPLELAKKISQSMQQRSIIAKVPFTLSYRLGKRQALGYVSTSGV